MTTQDETDRDAGASEGTVVVTEESAGGFTRQIGRASCRERVCHNV